jgi:hypothetical protein
MTGAKRAALLARRRAQVQITPPDPEQGRAARRRFRVQRARGRLDEPLGRAFAELALVERLDLALHIARDVVGFALRDALELQARYTLAPSYSEPIGTQASALAARAAALLAEIDAVRAALEALHAVPASEWAKWVPPTTGLQQPAASDDGAVTAPDLPQIQD